MGVLADSRRGHPSARRDFRLIERNGARGRGRRGSEPTLTSAESLQGITLPDSPRSRTLTITDGANMTVRGEL